MAVAVGDHAGCSTGSATGGLIVVGILIGTAGRRWSPRRRVQMTQMPQMVALYNGVGGGAAALIAWAEFRHRISSSAARSRSTI